MRKQSMMGVLVLLLGLQIGCAGGPETCSAYAVEDPVEEAEDERALDGVDQ